MKKFLFLKILILFFVKCVQTINFDLSYKKINVLIFKNDLKDAVINIKSPENVKISDFNDDENYFISKGDFCLKYKNNFWYLNSKKLKIDEIKIEALNDSFLKLNGNSYSGELFIRKGDNEDYLIINKLPLDDYVCFVLAKEVFGVWPKESHKVSAIITRTYALHKMIESRIRKKLFDIKSTNHDQTYSGIFWHKKIKDAVFETENEIILYKDKPIIAMYDICCGGISPSDILGFDFEKYPYLKRKNKCFFCKSYKDYEWEISFAGAEVLQKLSEFYGKKIIKISNIKIKTRKSKSLKDVTLDIILRNKHGKKYKENLKINFKDFRKIFLTKKKSVYFLIEWTEKNLKIFGKGNGHLMGLCQIGAKNMIDKNFNYKEIIDFYYPETYIKKMNFILG